jgi:mannonate dehydratase
MKLTFRWYGDGDPVTLSHIRQIPQMTGIVSAIYDTPVGEVWSRESIAAMKKKANDNGLAFEVVESVPVHEDIKLGNENAPRLIENYCENVRRLGEAGVKCICYNFMPVFDWLRSELEHAQVDGANALAYDENTVLAMDPLKGDLSLCGTRPPTVDEWEKYELRHRARLAIKPGITGLWQVSGRSNITDFEQVVELDKEYIRNWSMGMDLRILLKTVQVVLGRKGSM